MALILVSYSGVAFLAVLGVMLVGGPIVGVAALLGGIRRPGAGAYVPLLGFAWVLLLAAGVLGTGAIFALMSLPLLAVAFALLALLWQCVGSVRSGWAAASFWVGVPVLLWGMWRAAAMGGTRPHPGYVAPSVPLELLVAAVVAVPIFLGLRMVGKNSGAVFLLLNPAIFLAARALRLPQSL